MCNILEVADAAEVIVNVYAFTCERQQADRGWFRKIFLL